MCIDLKNEDVDTGIILLNFFSLQLTLQNVCFYDLPGAKYMYPCFCVSTYPKQPVCVNKSTSLYSAHSYKTKTEEGEFLKIER